MILCIYLSLVLRVCFILWPQFSGEPKWSAIDFQFVHLSFSCEDGNDGAQLLCSTRNFRSQSMTLYHSLLLSLLLTLLQHLFTTLRTCWAHACHGPSVFALLWNPIPWPGSLLHLDQFSPQMLHQTSSSWPEIELPISISLFYFIILQVIHYY